MVNFLKEAKAKSPILITGLAAKRFAASFLAMTTVLAATVPAWSTIDNTVTATGSSPGNTDDVTANASESVDVEDDVPSLSLVKTVVDDSTGLALGADVAAGTVVRYVFTVVNTGNVTVTDIGINEVSFDGSPALSPGNETSTNASGTSTDAGADGNWDSLAPGGEVVFTATYTVTTADISGQGGGDGDLDNEATASGDAPASTGFGTVTSPGSTASFDLDDANATLSVVKLATLLNGSALLDPDAADAAAGDVITYTYTVTNTGNVPITDISLADNVTAGSGADPVPGSEALLNDNGTLGDSTDAATNGIWDTLGVGDVITFTGTYTVTQSDVDNLQ